MMAHEAEAQDLRGFEDTYKRLEEIVARLEGGQLGLDDALKTYEEGVRSLRRCYGMLDAAERRLEILVEREDGAVSTEATTLEELRAGGRGAGAGKATADDAGRAKRETPKAKRAATAPKPELSLFAGPEAGPTVDAADVPF